MTNPDREDLFTPDELAVRLDEWASCLDKSQWDLRSDMRCAAIHLRRLASSDSGVKVRELEWRGPVDAFPTTIWEAKTPFGHYVIEEVSASDSPAYEVRFAGGHVISVKDGLNDAKSAAQRDYEARIKSARVDVPEVKSEPEPVAWQYRYRPRDTVEWSDWGDCGPGNRAPKMRTDAYEIEERALYTAPPADAGMREALEQIRTVCVDNAGDTVRHDLALKFVGEIASAALTAPGVTTKSDGAASDDTDTCIACAVPLVDGDMVYSDAGGGCIHAACCGPERESYVGNDGKPLKDGEPIPAPWPWTSDPSSTRSENQVMTDDQIKHMVDRFLMWKLPEHFSPDCGISFDPKYRSEHGPVGTNLFDVVQATAMVRHMLEGLPSTRSDRWVCAARQRGITLDPQDCDWPVCGCDPLASKVLDTIAESGFVIVPKDPSSARSDVTVDALADIAAERQRQREVEGWTAEHDDSHDASEMAGAAACYALSTIKHWAKDQVLKLIWPWADEWWKPKDARRNLVKAGALIVAEIERLDRAAKRSSTPM